MSSRSKVHVDKAKMDLISNLPPPRLVTNVRLFFGIKVSTVDLSNILVELFGYLTSLSAMDVSFEFPPSCLEATYS